MLCKSPSGRRLSRRFRSPGSFRACREPGKRPPASQAYYEATPQKLLSQSRFIHPELHRLVVDLFNAEVYGNIRRVQGLIRSAAKELQVSGHERANRRDGTELGTGLD